MAKKRHASKTSRRKPQWMITYMCPRCQMDSGRTELDGPYCFFCDRTDGLTELKREKLTKEILFARMKRSTDRMVKNLQKAMGIAAKDWPSGTKEELMLPEAMTKGMDLREAIREITEKRKGAVKKGGCRRDPSLHSAMPFHDSRGKLSNDLAEMVFDAIDEEAFKVPTRFPVVP